MATVLNFDIEKCRLWADHWTKWARKNRCDLDEFTDKVVDFMGFVKHQISKKESKLNHVKSN